MKRTEYPMPFVAGFFDESTDEDASHIYVIAGFAGNNLVTAVLEMRWQDVLKKYGLKYFKASELSAGLGQFQKFRDDPTDSSWRPFSDREKKLFDEIKIAFNEVIESCANGLYGIASVVILPDLQRLRAVHPPAKKLPRPYFLCTQMNLCEAGSMINDQNVGYTGHDLVWLRPIFDSHEEYSGRAKMSWDDFCHKNPESSKYLLPIHYETDQEYLTLQAADNLAFEIRKIVSSVKSTPRRPIRKSFKKVVEAGSLVCLYIFDYDALKILSDYQGNSSDKGLRERMKKTRFSYPIKTLFHRGFFDEDE